MLYSEFVEGTECRDNAHNYEVYKKLESLYTDYEGLSKSDIYNIGKKMVDNTPSAEELTLIDKNKWLYIATKKSIEHDFDMIQYGIDCNDSFIVEFNTNQAKKSISDLYGIELILDIPYDARLASRYTHELELKR